MTVIYRWPRRSPKRTMLSYPEVIAGLKRGQRVVSMMEIKRQRRARDRKIAGIWLLGAVTVLGVFAFMFF